MTVDTKTALLNSAERAARAHGFDGFSYADLAADVGIRKASIHHHFPTKAALTVALMQRYSAEIAEVCADIDAMHPSGGARLRALIAQYHTALDGGKSICLCVSFSISRDSLSPDVIAQIGQFRSMMIGWLSAVFEAGQTDGTIVQVMHPKREAAAVLAVLEGAQLSARAELNAALFDDALALTTARLTA